MAGLKDKTLKGNAQERFKSLLKVRWVKTRITIPAFEKGQATGGTHSNEYVKVPQCSTQLVTEILNFGV